MKNIGTINRIILIICVCVCVCSCNRTVSIEEEDISDKFNFSNKTCHSNEFIITVDTLVLFEVDKRRNGLRILPDDITVEIKIRINNISTKQQILYIRKNGEISSSLFFHHFKTDQLTDSIGFVNHGLNDSIVFNIGEEISISIGSNYFNYADLFSIQKDYTYDMILLIENSFFTYNYPDDSTSFKEPIIFSPTKETVVISLNTKWQ